MTAAHYAAAEQKLKLFDVVGLNEAFYTSIKLGFAMMKYVPGCELHLPLTVYYNCTHTRVNFVTLTRLSSSLAGPFCCTESHWRALCNRCSWKFDPELLGPLAKEECKGAQKRHCHDMAKPAAQRKVKAHKPSYSTVPRSLRFWHIAVSPCYVTHTQACFAFSSRALVWCPAGASMCASVCVSGVCLRCVSSLSG